MDLVKETQRSLNATVGVVAWAVDAVRAVPEQMGRAWQKRTEWMGRAGDTYDDLAGRGAAIMGSARQEVQHRVGQVGEAARWIPGVAGAEGEPWGGYDDMTVEQILPRMRSSREQDAVAAYEKRHKQRRSIIEAAGRG